jgi:chorismate mutase/prephenate dehydratase
MSLDKHRQAIDELDAQIVKLLNERTKHALGIGEIKLRDGKEIYAPHRERAIFERLAELNDGPIRNEALQAIYREIMSSSLSLEKTMTIAYLGPEATFTHQAALQKFGASLTYSAQKTIGDVFAEVSHGRADYGVAPIENSTEGVVTHTLDMFVESELKIVAQILLPIQHCLIGLVRQSDIERLYVHPQSLAQCRGWIQKNLPHAELIETSSNARSAELAKEHPKAAAIAGKIAADRYELDVLETDLQDKPDNSTRFLVLGRECGPTTGHDRTSILLSLRHQVGALHGALQPFEKNGLNMTKIESRPSRRKAWEYYFFVDCDGHADDPAVAEALRELEAQCNFVKILGSYPSI